MRLDTYAEDLRRNAIVHDQDLFAAPEVMATGRQTLAPSRRALLLELVRIGTIEWTPDVVDAIYAGLNSGVQHAFSVYHGDPDGWPDETHYVRAARADIVEADRHPSHVRKIADAFRTTGNPFGIDESTGTERSGKTVLFIDASTRALAPEVGEATRRLVQRVCPEAGELQVGTSGYELVDLGLWQDAAQGMAGTLNRLERLGAETVVTESPEAVVALTDFAAMLGLGHDLTVRHLTTWLPPHALGAVVRPLARRATYHDSSRLGRYLGVYEEPRILLRQVPELELVEMTYRREQAIPTGPAFGYPYPDAIPAMARRRLREARATGASLVIVGSVYSKRNLQAAGDRTPEIRHISEVLASEMGE